MIAVIEKGIQEGYINEIIMFIEERIEEIPAMKMIISEMLSLNDSVFGQDMNALETLFNK